MVVSSKVLAVPFILACKCTEEESWVGRQQVLVASNNRLGSADILGELPEESKLHHVDASNNYISRLRAPRNRGALRHISKLRLANNNLELVEEDAAMSLASLEWLDISGMSMAAFHAHRYGGPHSGPTHVNHLKTLFVCAHGIPPVSSADVVLASTFVGDALNQCEQS